jgi:hypothetical protein
LLPAGRRGAAGCTAEQRRRGPLSPPPPPLVYVAPERWCHPGRRSQRNLGPAYTPSRRPRPIQPCRLAGCRLASTDPVRCVMPPNAEPAAPPLRTPGMPPGAAPPADPPPRHHPRRRRCWYWGPLPPDPPENRRSRHPPPRLSTVAARPSLQMPARRQWELTEPPTEAVPRSCGPTARRRPPRPPARPLLDARHTTGPAATTVATGTCTWASDPPIPSSGPPMPATPPRPPVP